MSTTKGPITKFPADGLRPARRFISGHNKEGKGIFIGDDEGEHHRIMVEGEAVANIIYSTAGNPVDMNDDKDLKFAKENENLDESKAGRMLFILLDVEPYKAPNGEVLSEFLGDLAGDYADLH
ncbi:MAG: hypothetical protein Q9195_008092 [Heterodermia aff. obscurata]